MSMIDCIIGLNSTIFLVKISADSQRQRVNSRDMFIEKMNDLEDFRAFSRSN